MVTLTTDCGEFRADTEGEAIRAARKARREAVKAKKQRQTDRDTARLLAREVGWHAYYLHFQEGCNRWTMKPRQYCRYDYDDCGQTVLRFSRPNGEGTIKMFRAEVLGVVWDAGGFDSIVFLRFPDGDTLTASIGVCNGEVCLEILPGITIDMFAQD